MLVSYDEIGEVLILLVCLRLSGQVPWDHLLSKHVFLRPITAWLTMALQELHEYAHTIQSGNEVIYSDGAKAWSSMAKRHGHRSISVRHVLQEFTRKLKRKPWRASKIAGTQKADSSWKSIKKWIPDTLESTGRLCRRVSPQLLQYIRSWQWRSQEKNDCVSHLSKALKAMYAR